MFAITERLLLRPGWAEDAPALGRALGDERVARNLSRVPWPYCLGDAEAFLALPQAHGRPHFLIYLRHANRLVGGIGIADAPDGGGPGLGYWIARDHWGQGYATEAGRAAVAIADESLRLPRLTATHALDNPASGRVLRKLGFQPGTAGRLRSLARGGDIDVRHFTRERARAEAAPLAA